MEIQIIMEELSRYRDKWGVLVQADRDGGDSMNRTMAAYVYYATLNQVTDDQGREVLEGYNNARQTLEGSAPGRYRRHPDVARWYSNQNNFTRDQSIVLQSAMIVMDDKHHALDLFKARAKQGLLHFNTQSGDDQEAVRVKFPDPPAPIELSQFVRATRSWWFYPVLLITDLQLIVDVLAVRPIAKMQGNKDFDVQYLPILLSSQSRYRTPWSLIAKLLYARIDNVQSELRRYFKEGEGLNGLTPLGELACLAYQKGVRNE